MIGVCVQNKQTFGSQRAKICSKRVPKIIAEKILMKKTNLDLYTYKIEHIIRDVVIIVITFWNRSYSRIFFPVTFKFYYSCYLCLKCQNNLRGAIFMCGTICYLVNRIQLQHGEIPKNSTDLTRFVYNSMFPLMMTF